LIPNQLSRRSALLGIAVAATAVSTSSAEVAGADEVFCQLPKDVKIRICSPKDAFVSELLVVDGAEVAIDALLCHLLDDDEARSIQQVQLAKSLLALEAAALSDSQVALQRRVLELASDLAAKYLASAQAKAKAIGSYALLGQAPYDQVSNLQAEIAIEKANTEVEKSTLALKSFDFNVAQAKAKHDLIAQQIPLELAYLKGKQNRLSISCPVAGKIRLLAAKGSFIKLGDPIAEIV
jgi:hypothetical protein